MCLLPCISWATLLRDNLHPLAPFCTCDREKQVSLLFMRVRVTWLKRVKISLLKPRPTKCQLKRQRSSLGAGKMQVRWGVGVTDTFPRRRQDNGGFREEHTCSHADCPSCALDDLYDVFISSLNVMLAYFCPFSSTKTAHDPVVNWRFPSFPRRLKLQSAVVYQTRLFLLDPLVWSVGSSEAFIVARSQAGMDP